MGWNVIVRRPVHSAKQFSPIDATALPITTEDRREQPSKAPSPIDVTALPMVADVKPVQPSYLQLVVYQKILIKTVEK